MVAEHALPNGKPRIMAPSSNPDSSSKMPNSSTSVPNPATLASLVASVRRALSFPIFTADIKEYLAESNYDVNSAIQFITGKSGIAIGLSGESSESEMIERDDIARDVMTPDTDLSIQAAVTRSPENTRKIITPEDHGSNFTPTLTTKNNTIADKEANNLASKPAPTLMTLPCELRDQIFTELFVANRPIGIRQTSFSVGVRADPTVPIALARTCKQAAEECLPLFYSRNTFRLDLNILTAIDWLSSIPTAIVKGRMKSITLASAVMTGYVRSDYGLYDSSRLRNDLVKKLVYDLDIGTINLEVPDETRPPNAANNPFTTLMHYNPRNDYSWPLTREFLDTLLSGGAEEMRLCYPVKLTETTQESLTKLNAVSKLLYMDDDFEIGSLVKRIETARENGRRPEFKDKSDVERYVRSRRAVRKFSLKVGPSRPYEKGTAIVLTRPEKSLKPKGNGNEKEKDDTIPEGLGRGRTQRRELGRDYWNFP
jgi:hypothetical protein